MNRKAEIEARLERSLRKQIRAPQLDGRFDAAVWSRIEAEAQSTTAAPATIASKADAAARWLRAVNVAGVIVAVVLVAYFGAPMLSGAEIEVPLPSVSAEQSKTAMQLFGWAVTGAALLFGLMFTGLGRRLRNEFT